MLMRSLHKTSRGDTIVEVMIAVAVLALIIGTGYGIATRSLKGSRQAQEHAEALKLAEGQLERLKTHVRNNQTTVFNQTGGFCMDTNNSPVAETNTAVPPALVSSDLGTAKYNATCIQNQDASHCTTNCYYIGIRESSTDTFDVYVQWDGVTGRGMDQVKLTYRIHP